MRAKAFHFVCRRWFRLILTWASKAVVGNLFSECDRYLWSRSALCDVVTPSSPALLQGKAIALCPVNELWCERRTLHALRNGSAITAERPRLRECWARLCNDVIAGCDSESTEGWRSFKQRLHCRLLGCWFRGSTLVSQSSTFGTEENMFMDSA